jgi:hypothetical protein
MAFSTALPRARHRRAGPAVAVRSCAQQQGNGVHGDASSRPVKPSFSVVVALTLT